MASINNSNMNNEKAGDSTEKMLTTKIMLSYSCWQTFKRQKTTEQQDDSNNNYLHKQSSIKINHLDNNGPQLKQASQRHRIGTTSTCTCSRGQTSSLTDPSANDYDVCDSVPGHNTTDSPQYLCTTKCCCKMFNYSTSKNTAAIESSQCHQQNTQRRSTSIQQLQQQQQQPTPVQPTKRRNSGGSGHQVARYSTNNRKPCSSTRSPASLLTSCSYHHMTVMILMMICLSGLFAPTPPPTPASNTNNNNNNNNNDNKASYLCDNDNKINCNLYHYYSTINTAVSSLFKMNSVVAFAYAANPVASPTMSQSASIATLPDQPSILPIQQQQQPPPPPPPPPSSSATMMRPTIFSDSTGIVTSQNIGPIMPSPASISSVSQQQTNQALSPLLTDSQDVKINPFKSRLCGTNANLSQPLGMQSGAIDDLSLSASSSHNRDSVGPHLARLNQDGPGGAWCPMKPISVHNYGKEWIQIKLNRSHVISAIETQGRFGYGSGREYATHYQIEYSRDSGKSWHKWKDLKGNYLLKGNEDVNSVVKNELIPPIIGANVVKVLPFSQHLRAVCLRLELHGCPYDDGAPIAYSMMDGATYEPRYGRLNDVTYDGQRRLNLLTAGLGQLVDGYRAHDNYKASHGFGWLGWKATNGDVMIEFQFNTVRNFTGALFFSNNMFTQGIEVFQAIDVQYGIDVASSTNPLEEALQEQALREQQQRQQREGSFQDPTVGESQPEAARFMSANSGGNSQALVDGNDATVVDNHFAGQQHPPPEGHDGKSAQLTSSGDQTLWSTNVVSMEYEPDKASEETRPVMVHLKQIIANRLRFVLKFASKWILISEVEFLSQAIDSLSLTNVQKGLTPELVSRLGKSRSYDEYIAVLKTDQLRNQAASAFLNGYGTTANSLLNQQPALSSPKGTVVTDQDDPPQMQGTNVIGPKIPPGNGWISAAQPQLQQPRQHQPIVIAPSLPAFSQQDQIAQQQQPKVLSGYNPSNTRWVTPDISNNNFAMMNQQPIDLPDNSANSNGGGGGGVINKKQQQQIGPAGNSASRLTTSTSVSVIVIVLSSIIILAIVIFSVFSYRLRNKHHTQTTSSHLHHAQIHGGHHGGHHLKSNSGTGLVGRPGSLINGTGINSFMNVFTPNGGYSGIFQQSSNNNQQVSQGLTLKRSSQDSANTASPSPVLSGNGAGMTTSNPQTSLLVSLKEPSLFSSMTSKAGGQHHHQQQVFNTQLIVGMNNNHNQTMNPHHHHTAQSHHIYNGLNYGNTTNNTYGGHGYSTTMSMASSSNAGDYNEYAIPDAQPMIPPPGTLHNTIQQQQQQLMFHQDLQNRRTLINPHKTINIGNNQSLIYQSGSLVGVNHYEGIPGNNNNNNMIAINARPPISSAGVPCQLISTTLANGLNQHQQTTTTVTTTNSTANDTNGSSSPASIGNSATTNTTSASSIGSGGHYYASADAMPSIVNNNTRANK